MRSSSRKVCFVGSSLLLSKAATSFVVNNPHARTLHGLVASQSHQRASSLQQHRHLSFLSDLFGAPTLASRDDVQKALKNPDCILVDVRSEGEISSSGKVEVQGHAWVNAPGSPFDCPLLTSDADTLLPNKQAPVLLYCASGKRASKAKEILERQGYQNVLNAGGASTLMSYL